VLTSLACRGVFDDAGRFADTLPAEQRERVFAV
jgi:hypothetical protein